MRELIKSMKDYILKVKDKIYFEEILHIGLVIATAIGSAKAHSSTYGSECAHCKFSPIWCICIFIFFYITTMIVDWYV